MVAMLIFRARGRQASFTDVQIPLMASEFWRSPIAGFAPDGNMKAAMVANRKQERTLLLCASYRQVPQRTLGDDDWDFVRSFAGRT